MNDKAKRRESQRVLSTSKDPLLLNDDFTASGLQTLNDSETERPSKLSERRTTHQPDMFYRTSNDELEVQNTVPTEDRTSAS